MKGFHLKFVKVFLLLVFAQVTWAQTDFALSVMPGGNPIVLASGGGIQQLTYTVSNPLSGMDEGDQTTLSLFYDFQLFPVSVDMAMSDPLWNCTEVTQQIDCDYGGVFTAGTNSTLVLNVTAPVNDLFLMGAVNATLTNATGDPNPGNNSINSDINFISGGVDLEIIKTINGAFPDTVAPGEPIGFDLTVTNVSGGDASNVSVIDDLIVNNLIFDSVNSSPECNDMGSFVQCDALDLPTGDSLLFTIAAMVDVSAQPGPKINTASVSADETEIFPANNSSDIGFNVAVAGSPEIEVIKTIVGGLTQATPGSVINYEVQVNNTGAGNALNVDLTDTIPAGVSYQNHMELGPNFNCSFADPILSCNAPSLPNTAAVDGVNITVLVDGTAGSEVSNTASSTFLDSDAVNNVSSVLFDIVAPVADLDVAIAPDQTTYTVGDLITLEVTVHNPFGSTGEPTNTTVITTLPVETVFNSAQTTNATGWLCTHDGSAVGGDVTCESQGNPLLIGTNTFIDVIAVASTAGTGLNPNVSVTSDFDPNPSNDFATTFVDIFAGDADLSLIFTSASGVYNQGDSIFYGIQVNNPMGSTASPSDVTVDVTLPFEVSYTNVDLSNAPGWFCVHDGSATGGDINCDRGGAPFVSFSTDDIGIEVLALSPATGANVSANIFSAADSFTSNNADSQVDVINPGVSDFNISKTVSATNFAVNDSFTYFLNITNPASSSASPVDVVINDQLPPEVSFDSFVVANLLGTTVNCVHDGSATGGLFSCDTNGLPFSIGDTVTIDVNVTAVTASPNVNNSATVETLVDPDGTTANNNDAAPTVVITGPSVTVVTASKSASVAGVLVTEISYGQSFEYLLEVQNTGLNDAQNVTVTDTLPAEVSWVSTQATGWTCSTGIDIKTVKINSGVKRGTGSDIDCTLDVPLTPGTTSQIVVNVIATTNTSVNSITNTMFVNGDNTGVEVNAVSVLSLQNSQASLTISQTPTPVDPGADVEFSLVAENTGTTDLNGLQIDSQLPTDFTYSGFSGDATWMCNESAGTVSCVSSGTLASGTNSTLVLETTATTPQLGQTYVLDAVLSANELSADINQSQTVAFSTSDVTVIISSNPQQVSLGEPFKHLIQINNSGNFDLVNVSAFYSIPEAASLLGVVGNDFNCSNSSNIITCNNLQPLLAGDAIQIELNLQVDAAVGLVGGNVSVNADGILKTASTSTQIMTDLLNDLALTKTASTNQIGQNETFSYQFDVINSGMEAQTGFSLTDQLPAGVVFQSASGAEWSCGDGSPLICQYSGSLASGEQTQLVINVIAPNEIGSITNTANINLTTDENASNDSSSVVVNVVEGGGGGGQARADLSVMVEANNPDVLSTEQVIWRIEVSNAGPDEAENVIISNTLPIGFLAESVQVSNGVECTLLESSLNCEVSTLAVNQTVEIILEGGFMNGFSGFIINTVEVQSDAIDQNPGNNSSSGEVTVTNSEDLTADLALELNISNQETQQGGLVDLSFIAKNLGPDRAVKAQITGGLSGLIETVQLINTSGWMCQVNSSALSCEYPGDFEVGMQSEISLRVQTQQVVQQSQPIIFNASIVSESMDNQPANNVIGFTNEVTRTPTEDEIFAVFQNAVGSAASETVIQSIRNVSSYCARSYFMAIEGLCEEFIEDATPENGGAIINAMEELTPNEVTAQSNSAAEIMTSQFRNVGSRLAQLRGGGGSGLNVAGLNGRYGNESIPLGMLAYLNQSEDEQAVSNIDDFVSPWGFFVNGNISMGERDATGQELGFDFDTFGLTAGVDYRFSPTKVAGVALGYANFDSEIEGEAEIKSTGFTLTGYGSFYIKDNFYVDARISYGNPDFEQKRRINFAVDEIVIDRVASGETDSDQYSVAMSAGYHFNKNSWNITPNASVRYVRTTIDAFRESGAGGFNFAFGEQEVKSMVWSVGTSISKAISLKNGVISPQFDINLSRETENDGGFLEARFIDAPDDEIFFIGTDEPDRTYGSAGVGLVFIGANGKQAYINYRSIFGLEGFTRGTINVGARFEF